MSLSSRAPIPKIFWELHHFIFLISRQVLILFPFMRWLCHALVQTSAKPELQPEGRIPDEQPLWWRWCRHVNPFEHPQRQGDLHSQVGSSVLFPADLSVECGILTANVRTWCFSKVDHWTSLYPLHLFPCWCLSSTVVQKWQTNMMKRDDPARGTEFVLCGSCPQNSRPQCQMTESVGSSVLGVSVCLSDVMFLL